MADGRIFEYAVLFHPKKVNNKDGGSTAPKSELLVDVKRIVAGSEQEVAMLAARDIPEEYIDRLDLVEIAVRPF